MEGELPIVTFGKYKNKPVTELIADVKYVEWLKTQAFFEKQTTIYNIVVNQQWQTGGASVASCTPQHNQLQNSYLQKEIQKKLVDNHWSVRNSNILCNLKSLAKYFKPFSVENVLQIDNDHATIEFESQFNWDFVMNYTREYNPIFLPFSDFETKRADAFRASYELEQSDIFTKEVERHNKNIKKYSKRVEECNEDVKKFHEDIKKYNEEYEKNKQAKKGCLKKLFQQDPTGFLDIAKKSHDNEVITLNTYRCDWNTKYDTELKKACLAKRYSFYTSLFHRYGLSLTSIDSTGCHVKYNYVSVTIAAELKPLLGDDYPCVLRKMKTQKTLYTKSNYESDCVFYLIVESFQSKVTTKEQLIEIFEQSNIHVYFHEEDHVLKKHPIDLEDIVKKLTAENAQLTEENRTLQETIRCLETQLKRSIDQVSATQEDAVVVKKTKSIHHYFESKKQ
jgi:uncharacterized protein YeaO (DUF488 family)